MPQTHGPRSCTSDDQILTTTGGLGSRLGGFFNYGAIVSPEQEMAFIMDRVGPVIAIGRPGERLPELGAARLYVGDDQWREVVGNLLNRAALVVIRAGDTPNLWWEIAEARNRCPLERIVIVALGPPSALTTFERRFAETFGVATAPSEARPSRVVEMLLRWVFAYARASGKILYFDRQGRPYEQPLSRRVTPSTVIMAPLTAYRPHRDSLQSAFKIVFARLGLHWTPKRTLTIAVILALFGGIFGLHHFYMGNRRRAIWYVAFFWLIVPILLGWIDAVRLALLNDAQFQAQLGGREDAVSGER